MRNRVRDTYVGPISTFYSLEALKAQTFKDLYKIFNSETWRPNFYPILRSYLIWFESNAGFQRSGDFVNAGFYFKSPWQAINNETFLLHFLMP